MAVSMDEDEDISRAKTAELAARQPIPDGTPEPPPSETNGHSTEEPVSADASLFAGDIPVDPFSGDPFVGQMVGNCRILERINEGGSSLIYRAYNVNFNLDRVIKILKPTRSEEQDKCER